MPRVNFTEVLNIWLYNVRCWKHLVRCTILAVSDAVSVECVWMECPMQDTETKYTAYRTITSKSPCNDWVCEILLVHAVCITLLHIASNFVHTCIWSIYLVVVLCSLLLSLLSVYLILGLYRLYAPPCASCGQPIVPQPVSCAISRVSLCYS